MRKLFFVLTLATLETNAQTLDYKKSPNSFIFDTELAQANNYGGIYIPIKKAYEMWANFPYLRTNGQPTPIPSGNQTASIYWEDVPGLISNVSISPGSSPEESRIKVDVRKSAGKGNAVIAFKVNNIIYWSWHIWVTDNPSNGISYSQGFETDINMNPIQIQYMDRNLGAVASHFIGNDWQKSGGLLYEWGRKDPFPPLVYKDNEFYQITGEVGSLRHKQAGGNNTIPVKLREFNEIEKNIQFSVKNPITYIINSDQNGNWFSSSRYKVAGTSPDYITWDLWSDNAKGGNSNANSSSTTLKNESRSYELKSELDPCPNGWRIPSYYGRETQNNNLSFFGRKGSGVNDDQNLNNRQFFPDSQNSVLDGIKVYPGLGIDFRGSKENLRNIGVIPTSGAYVYYPNSVAPNEPIGIIYQDENSTGGLWSSTYGYDGGRLFSFISDPYRSSTSVGLHAIFNNQTNPTKTGNAVRCMKDPNLAQIGNFATEYFNATQENYTKGLDYPNTYLIEGDNRLVEIPVNKAFSVYNQKLSEGKMLNADNLVSKVLWTTNKELVQSIQIIPTTGDKKDSKILVQLKPNQFGNAIISLHNGDTSTPAYWSWLIWVPKDKPSQNEIKYLTEKTYSSQLNFVNPTVSKQPPLLSKFMDRNIGAILATPSTSNTIDIEQTQGLHFQWGRKDAIPAFANDLSRIFLGSENSSANGILTYTEVNNSSYESSNFTSSYNNYGSTNNSKYEKLKANILYSVQNPLTFMYQPGQGMLYNGGNHYANDLSQVRDWVSNERGDVSNRWGHASEKSIYDPCPAGWRVPDVSLTNLYIGSKGNSPWFNSLKVDATNKPGVIQDQWYAINNYYSGKNLEGKGWSFQDSTFKIGNFAKDNTRGELGGNQLSNHRYGVWTAALSDMNTGFALAMQFDNDTQKMQTGGGAYPQAAMGVRCMKDELRLISIYIEDLPSGGTLDTNEPSTITQTPKVEVYPNPFNGELTIKGDLLKNFEIYNMVGQRVLAGNLTSNTITTTPLVKGVYLLKITKSNGEIVTKKVIKN